ncbi:MAG TPA: MarR family transcriptional regulator [Candidatus Baltobacteraceae bacterium]|jgi:DNA-binding MarR family transcriptional regulator|nr:MarR family transcriptional regulator [Candidatus Baltobacteraceae bacterium]
MLSENAALALGMLRAEGALRRRLEAPLGARHGIGFTDFAILTELSTVQGGRLRAIDLAQRLVLSPSGVTRAVLPLEKIGLLQRVPHDRDARGSYIQLTQAGRERVAQALETVEQTAGEVFAANLTRSDRIALLGLFERFSY